MAPPYLMPYEDDGREPLGAPEEAESPGQPDAPGYAQPGWGVVQGQDGSPVMANGRPLTWGDYYDAQPRGNGHAPNYNPRAAAASSMQWGTGDWTPQQKAAFMASYHPEQLAAQQAQAAGYAPNYGLPGGPELDPRLRQQVQDAELNIQRARTDPSLSTEQRLAVVKSMGDRIQQLDPAGRYRNGQQPMTAVQKAMAQMVHEDEDGGVIYTVNPKTGEVKVHEMRQEKAEKDTGFDGLTFQQQHKMVDDFARQYGISHDEAVQHIRRHEQMIRGGGQQFNYPDTQAGQAARQVQQQWDAAHGLRPLRDREDEQRHTDNVMKMAQQEQARQEKLQQQREQQEEKRNAALERQQAAWEKAMDRMDETDRALQERSTKYGEVRGKYESSQKVKGTNNPAPEPDPDRMGEYAAQHYKASGGRGVLGVPLSHVETHKLLTEQLPKAMRDAADDPERAAHLQNLQRLAEAYPRGPKSMSKVERGYWLLGQYALDPNGKHPTFRQFDAIDPRNPQE